MSIDQLRQQISVQRQQHMMRNAGATRKTLKDLKEDGRHSQVAVNY
jgi:hypothetical protein